MTEIYEGSKQEVTEVVLTSKIVKKHKEANTKAFINVVLGKNEGTM